MKGFVLAAGMGTRLKPWTDEHPKALVPINGVPMLQRVIEKMYEAGIVDITVNVHHFADQIIDFIDSKGWNIHISDERETLLETGGAFLHASKFFVGDEPVLVHNVDILSNANFKKLDSEFTSVKPDALLLVSDRDSSRKLLFYRDMRLIGWHNLKSGEYRPSDFNKLYYSRQQLSELAFSGIYVLSPLIADKMRSHDWKGRFPIMDFFLSTVKEMNYYGTLEKGLEILDIGKPDSLQQANIITKGRH